MPEMRKQLCDSEWKMSIEPAKYKVSMIVSIFILTLIELKCGNQSIVLLPFLLWLVRRFLCEFDRGSLFAFRWGLLNAFLALP